MLKNYSAILSRLNGSCWYMSEDSLKVLLEIIETRAMGIKKSDEEIHMLLHAARMENGRRDGGGQVRGLGILPLYGPIFPKANMMTEMSGATSLQQFRESFREMMNNDFVSTIVLDVDSPGGHADMVRETAREIREARETKDIIAVANTQANSAAYYIASQATQMYATDSGLVGSVGVFLVHTDTSRKEEMEGVKHTIISAGDNKAEHLQPLTPESRSHLQSLVDEMYDHFVEDVSLGRNTTQEDVRENYGGGRVFTAAQAMELGMIDGVRTLDSVVGRLIESGGDIRVLSAVPTLRSSYDADKEHSEPGTGQGGEPTPREPPEKGDKAIEGGWRRDPVPPAYDEVEESVMNRVQMEALATKLDIEFSAETSDEELATSIDSRVDEVVVPLNTAAADAEKQRQWEVDYPEQAAQMRELLESSRTNNAKEFAALYASFEDDPKRGFSTLVRDEIQSAHEKVTLREFGHTELKSLIDVMATKAAIVPLGEEGSNRTRETSAATGSIREDRKRFAQLVTQAITEDGMDRKAALKHVAEQHPELAAAYRGGR